MPCDVFRRGQVSQALTSYAGGVGLELLAPSLTTCMACLSSDDVVCFGKSANGVY